MKHFILLYYSISFCSIFFVISLIALSLLKTKEKIIIKMLFFYIFLLLFVIIRIIVDYYKINNVNYFPASFIINFSDILISVILIATFVYFTHSLFLIPYRGTFYIFIVIASLLLLIQDNYIFVIYKYSELNAIDNITFEIYSSIISVYTLIVMLIFFKNIKNEFHKNLSGSILIYLVILIPSIIADSFHHFSPLKIFFLPLSILFANIIIIRFFIINFFLISKIPENNLNHFTDKYNITIREKDIIKMLIDGYTYNKISNKLFISLSTVKTHIYNIYQKTGVKTRYQLINLIKK